jgi:carbon-monoxide dehydrogenase large subunit
MIFCEQTAHGTPEFIHRGMPLVSGYQSARVEMDPQGKVTVYTGLQSHGQGMETTLAQVVADELSIPLEAVRVIHGDTGNSPYAMGTWGSRGSVLGGGSVALACRDIGDKLRSIAAHHLEIDPGDLALHAGSFTVKGAPDRAVSITTLARWALQEPSHLPPGMPPGLQQTRFLDGVERGVFSNGCHAAVVTVDPKLGTVELVRYVAIEDCGTMINPMIVDGQVQGGVAQGIGSALLEEIIYDAAGQPLTTTFADYLLPGTTNVPNIEVYHLETPSPLTPLGNKGVGEAGAIAPMAAIGNAVSDALGRCVTEAPMNLERTWRLAAYPSPPGPLPP